MLIFDSSILVAHLRGEANATRFLRSNNARFELVIPALVAWELWKGATTKKRTASVRRLLESFTVDPFTAALADLAGALHVEHRQRGLERPTIDLLIASHAIFHDAPIATLDHDYDYVDGLQVVRMEQD